MSKSLLIAVVAAFALGGAAAAAVLAVGFAGHAVSPPWREVAWPFPLDQWGRGRALRCAAADCGAEVTILLRAKTGFCNCTTGIADDDELDRVSDAELFGPDLTARAAGRAIRAGGLDGRSRVYAGVSPGQGIIAAAFHSNCDAIVATVMAASARLDLVEPVVLTLLNRKVVMRAALVAVAR